LDKSRDEYANVGKKSRGEGDKVPFGDQKGTDTTLALSSVVHVLGEKFISPKQGKGGGSKGMGLSETDVEITRTLYVTGSIRGLTGRRGCGISSA